MRNPWLGGFVLACGSIGTGLACTPSGPSTGASMDSGVDAVARSGAGTGGAISTGGTGTASAFGTGGTSGTGGTTSGGIATGGATGTGGTNDARDGGRDTLAPQDARIADARDAGVDSPPTPDAFTGVDAAGPTAVSYVSDTTTIFPNPERGFYGVNEVQTSSYQALDLAWLQGLRGQGVGLVFHMVYLDSFVNSDLSQTFLTALATDFTTIRSAGVKAVLRFAYTPNATPPYGDASKTRVLGHIAQLKPVLFANSDVIAALQAGFIGAWGEWFYTDYFGDQGTISASQWTDRQDVVNALLGALDLGRPVQLRTPAFKQHFYGPSALTPSEGFSGTAKARVGHHNDCFLASADDEGTYANVTADKAYLAQESLYVPQGGETCATSTYASWANALTDMGNLRWSFLNMDYNPSVLSGWGTNIDIARRRLGYRLSLVSGAYTPRAQAGSEIDVQLTIHNDGFAPPFLPRELNVVLRNTGSNAVYVAKLPDDPRRFPPGASTTIAAKVCLPASLPPGSYALLLALADPVPGLRARPEYSIRLANQGTWEASTGYNNLDHTLAVAAAPVSPTCSAEAIAAVAGP